MKLKSGIRLGPYEIVGVVGAGGMGEVYRARDPRIERDVAIKVLPESFAADPDRLHRFEQEARAAGATNHPNLVTVFDLGEVDGAPYLVMELLEGETLRERIGDARPDKSGAGDSSGTGRGLSVRRVLEIATQIAQGLAAAHDRQIVHRDLKPENVFITNDGRVKILDFGLAKLSGTASSEHMDAVTVQRNTSPGTVLGTAGYMSPEQVRGQSVDHRTDIFAFGAILYEMLTGRRAFFGASGADTMSAILKEDPPEPSEIVPSLPPGMNRIVRHCLEKSPERRFQSARDLAFDLESIGETSGLSGARHATEASARVVRARIGLAAGLIVALAAALATGVWIGSRGEISGNVVQQPDVGATFTQLTFQSGVEFLPSLAPDGKTFIFTSFEANRRRPDVFLQRVDGRTAINLTKTEDQAEMQAVFSRDGSEIAFRVGDPDGGIFVMGATGESRRRVTDFGWNPSWSPDGRFIAVSEEPVFSTPDARNADSRLWTVEVANGTKRQLTKTDAVQPSWSPNGHRVAFWTVSSGGQRDIATLDPSADDPDSTIVMVTDDPPLDWGPAWSSDGRYLYFGSERDGTRNLWRVSIDEATGKVLGELEPVTLPATMAGHFSVAGDLVAYSSFETRDSVLRATLDPNRGRFGDAEKIMGGSMLVFSLSSSPGAESIAFSSRGTQEDIFLMKGDGSELRQLTNDSARDRGPSFSTDSRQIFFYSDREDGVYDIYRIATDGSGVTRITRTDSDDRAPIWFPVQSPDGRWLAASSDHGFGLYDLGGALPLTEYDTPPPYPDEALHCWRPKWSPDGRRLLLSVQHTESGTGRPGVVVYTIESREYELVRETGFPIAWVDDGTILVGSDEDAVTLDLETRRERAIDLPEDADRIFGLAHVGPTLFFVRASFEADIWLADLGSSN